jgi:hypothetical protein
MNEVNDLIAGNKNNKAIFIAMGVLLCSVIVWNFVSPKQSRDHYPEMSVAEALTRGKIFDGVEVRDGYAYLDPQNVALCDAPEGYYDYGFLHYSWFDNERTGEKDVRVYGKVIGKPRPLR